MIHIPSGVRVWIATGHTDMRRGMNSLAVLVQEAFKRDPHGGEPTVLQAADSGCRQPGRILAEQRRQRLGEVAGRDPLQIKDRQQRLDRLRPAHVSGACSAKLFAGPKQRFSDLAKPSVWFCPQKPC